MATRVRMRIEQTATGYIVHKQSGVDGELPSNASADPTEKGTLQEIKNDALGFQETFEQQMGQLGILALLSANQGDATKLNNAVVSVVLDTDPGQFGVRITIGS